MIPTEAVPDGAILAPHHFTYGLLATLPFMLRVWDNQPLREPFGVFGSVLGSLFGFLSIWPFYPVAGCLVAVAGLSVATVAVAGYRRVPFAYSGWTRATRYPVLIGLAFAWDDWISHSFGVWTPLDAAWKAHLLPIIA